MASSNNGHRRPILDRDTLFPGSVAIAFGISAFYLGGKIQGVEGRLQSIEDTLVDVADRNVSRQEFEVYKARLQAANPSLVVPE